MTTKQPSSNAERRRLIEARDPKTPWKRWGPYLSERQWGTVREDYSHDGNAWDSFPHDHARSRAYKWGEDGIAGFSDDQQRLCWALALWNGRDPIIKERLFGLTNGEGNHGEDVKECYWYLDSTPTHSWMRFLYRYPQREYPYGRIVLTNRARGRHEPEYELIDTGVFDEDRFFDVTVDFAKASPDDTCIRITVANRGPEAATLHVLPHLWFRNDWWMKADAPRPEIRAIRERSGLRAVAARHHELGAIHASFDGTPELLFTENESNTQRLWGRPGAHRFVKDGINDRVVQGRTEAVNPECVGTKCAAHYVLEVPARTERVIRVRLSARAPSSKAAFDDFDRTMSARRREADDFYAEVIPSSASADRALVMRQAFAGLLWSKQFYYFDLDRWLDEHGANPVSGGRRRFRNCEWFHMLNRHVISMPDKWEYPWYAAWDLAFHVLPLHLVDPDFAREQLALMLHEHYMHPSGQIPAYEWNFGDVNPPVHAWATHFVHQLRELDGEPDPEFLRVMFERLGQNFNWWINRKDPEGRSLFGGGFLGLDNIGVFDRSAPIPGGGVLLQADGTAWMAFYSHCMLQMAVALAKDDPAYENAVAKYTEHFLWIAGAIHRAGNPSDGLWDEDDGFFYDVLVIPGQEPQRIRVRSMVGLLPLMASTVFVEGSVKQFPTAIARLRGFVERHPELAANIHPFSKPGHRGRRLLSLLNESKLRRLLARMLDERQFLSPYGLRSLSLEHADHPYVLRAAGEEFRIGYQPAESLTGTFGGNSNWRGPIWFPVNVLLVRGLLNLYAYFGDEFTVECPTGSGRHMNLFEVSKEIAHRLERIFLLGKDGHRPVNGHDDRDRTNPLWRDLIPFYEYFHGETGQGLGASHQTGWTGLVAFTADLFERVGAPEFLREGRGALKRLSERSSIRAPLRRAQRTRS